MLQKKNLAMYPQLQISWGVARSPSDPGEDEDITVPPDQTSCMDMERELIRIENMLLFKRINYILHVHMEGYNYIPPRFVGPIFPAQSQIEMSAAVEEAVTRINRIFSNLPLRSHQFTVVRKSSTPFLSG